MNNKKVFSNLIWRFMERTGSQSVSFVVSIILARLLAPEAYGTIALITVFTALLQVFINSGLGVALIQKKDADDLDFSTVFYFNIVLCLVLYGLLCLSAPLIADFYGLPELTPLIKTLGFTLVISGVNNIQQSYVSKTMQFKRFFFATLGGTLFSAVIGIVMAYKGYGVWALVVQKLTNDVVNTAILWITVKWRPKWIFSRKRLKGLFSHGWKLLVSALLDAGYRDLRQLIIGKVYTTSDLAFYNKANQLPKLVVGNINLTIDSVLLPVLATEQDNRERVKAMTRRAIKTSTYIMMPMMMGLAMCAEPLIRLLLTEKWLPSVLYLRIFCFTYAFYPIHTANLNAIKAMGRSDLYLTLEVVKKIVGLTVLFSTMFISVEAMAYSLLFTSLSSQIINSWPNKKLLNYSYLEQVKDMLPQIFLSCVMGMAVYAVKFLGLVDIVSLLIQLPLGILIYVLGSAIFDIEAYRYLLDMVKRNGRKKAAVEIEDAP